MKMISLQSGSNGNCIYVESQGIRLLFDAGISGRRAQERLAAHNLDIASVQALLISHDHWDHTSGMGVFQRKFGMPIHATAQTVAAVRSRKEVGRLTDVQHFRSGATLCFGHVSVETIPTPHDGVDGVAFIIDDGTNRLGILTDLGHAFPQLIEILPTLDAILIESNYDPTMLANGPYPEPLKRRICGPRGHLSNDDSAQLIHSAASCRLKWVCLGHLSQENNKPEIALAAHRFVLGHRIPLRLANRYAATDVMEV